MSRVRDRLLEHSLERHLRETAQLAHELKARQRLSGASGQLGYAVASTNNWDLTGSLPTSSPPNFNYAEFEVTFTGDGSQEFPVAIPSTDIRINGTALSNQLRYDPAVGWVSWSSGSNIVRAEVYDQADVTLLQDPTRLRWKLGLYYSGTIAYYLKTRAHASCPGSISVVRTA